MGKKSFFVVFFGLLVLLFISGCNKSPTGKVALTQETGEKAQQMDVIVCPDGSKVDSIGKCLKKCPYDCCDKLEHYYNKFCTNGKKCINNKCISESAPKSTPQSTSQETLVLTPTPTPSQTPVSTPYVTPVPTTIPNPNLQLTPTANETPASSHTPTPTPVKETQRRNCRELGGYLCNPSDKCALDWLDSTESYCCPIECNTCAPETLNSCVSYDKCKKATCGPDTNFQCQIVNLIPCPNNGVCEIGEFYGTMSFCDGSRSGYVGNPSVSSDCPSTCDDGIWYTEDYYDSKLQRCVNEVCEEPKCPASCDDGDNCTFDYCDETTQYLCEHEPIDYYMGTPKREKIDFDDLPSMDAIDERITLDGNWVRRGCTSNPIGPTCLRPITKNSSISIKFKGHEVYAEYVKPQVGDFEAKAYLDGNFVGNLNNESKGFTFFSKGHSFRYGPTIESVTKDDQQHTAKIIFISGGLHIHSFTYSYIEASNLCN